MQADLASLEEAVKQADAALGQGTVVLVDAADAPSSGASGDGNAVLRALVEHGYRGRCLLPIVDAPAVRAAFAAGVGKTIRTTLGGAVDPARFTPLPVEVRVRILADGRHVSESHGIEWQAGETAVLELVPSGHVVVATSRPVSLYDRSLFLGHGQDPKRFDAVVQKSPHARHEFFAAWVHGLIGVDAPGSTSANLPSLGHTRCRRPIYPLDPDAVFQPEVLTFGPRQGR
jgi:microcystin degradation protein MlrC